MKTFIRVVLYSMLFLLGMSMSMAQDVSFIAGPTITLGSPANNGGFTWGDVNKDGYLDVLVRQNNLMINNGSTFTQSAIANIPAGADAVGVAFADFNGDGVLDMYELSQSTNIPSVLINNAGVFTAKNTGDLGSAGATGTSYGGITVGDIDHSNNLTLVYAGLPSSGNLPATATASNDGGVYMYKYGASGFTSIGRGSATPVIDQSRTFESWNIAFFDATNDGYPDLLMPGYRSNTQAFDVNNGNGTRKGTILYVNDGTGKFYVPDSSTLHRPIYEIDSISGGVIYAGMKKDTGVIVDDTVRHFEGLCALVADFNNDGNMDIIFASNGSAINRDAFETTHNNVIIYGKGDGTFTYKWNGTNVVASGLPVNSYIRSWAAGDYNNDGYVDVLGSDNTNCLFKNNGNGTFTNMTTADNLSLLPSATWRSIGFVDYNNDGLLDIFAYTGTNIALLKSSNNTNKWIGFQPIGSGNNQSAIGAKFTLFTDTVKQTRIITSDAGAEGMGGTLWANFGIGTRTKVDSLHVQWPDGNKQSFILNPANNTLAVNKYYTIQEGSIIPTAPVITRPSWAAGDTSLTSSDTLKWTAATTGSGTTTYTVQIATNSSFTTIAKTITSVPDEQHNSKNGIIHEVLLARTGVR